MIQTTQILDRNHRACIAEVRNCSKCIESTARQYFKTTAIVEQLQHQVERKAGLLRAWQFLLHFGNMPARFPFYFCEIVEQLISPRLVRWIPQ